ncbi:hypothetical protein [Streptomyces sp. NPDC017529]|uniref:hypothetical protein n=1 Tax=Streptomyces sp. NPDC017529 TaxID=3365000 RepID=UPI0037A105BF
MGAEQETVWMYCQRFARQVYSLAVADPECRAALEGRYKIWKATPESIEPKARAQIALALHSLAMDQAADSTPADAGRVTVSEVADAVHSRPVHELFASLPAEAGRDEQVQALKLLAYSSGRNWTGPEAASIFKARVTSTALDLLAAATDDDSLPCAALIERAD